MIVWWWLACGAPSEAPPVAPTEAPEPALPATDSSVELVRPLEVARRMGDAGAPMVLNFWATWCGPCRAEQPRLHAWATDHPEVRMVWVSLDLAKLREPAVVPALRGPGYLDGAVEQWQLDDPDPAMAMGKLLPDWKGVVPTTVAVDAEGQVVRTWARAVDDDDLTLLEELLAP